MAHKSEDGNVYVWTVVDKATGEIGDGEEIRDYEDDDFYELIEGFEWRRFKLVPAP